MHVLFCFLFPIQLTLTKMNKKKKKTRSGPKYKYDKHLLVFMLLLFSMQTLREAFIFF